MALKARIATFGLTFYLDRVMPQNLSKTGQNVKNYKMKRNVDTFFMGLHAE